MQIHEPGTSTRIKDASITVRPLQGYIVILQGNKMRWSAWTVGDGGVHTHRIEHNQLMLSEHTLFFHSEPNSNEFRESSFQIPGKILDIRWRLPAGAILIKIDTVPPEFTCPHPKKLVQCRFGPGKGTFAVFTI